MHREHRRRFLDLLRRERAAAVVFTATPRLRNGDSEHRFRPGSDFWYLTGFGEPGAALVLLPGLAAGEGDRCVLFLRERDREREIWDGRRLGVERAAAELGVDEAWPIGELWSKLEGLLRGRERIVYQSGVDGDRDRRMLELLALLRQRARGGVAPPRELVDPAASLHELRLFKGPAELERMRRAAAISAEAHRAAMAASAPGVRENEIDALLEYTFRRRGGSGAAYTNIVAGGANACVLHYVENDAELADGELLLVDAGAEYDWYASDVTRTWPVNGRFTPDQRALYELVLAAQRAAIEVVRPGARFDAVHAAALGRIVDGLIELGLLEGPREAALEDETYRRFFMHKTSHWLGLDVHDCGAYHAGGESRALEPGMVLTVEPGVYVAADDESVEQRWRGIGVRIEDDVAVTADGRELLTSAVPREVDEVEAACRGAARPELVSFG